MLQFHPGQLLPWAFLHQRPLRADRHHRPAAERLEQRGRQEEVVRQHVSARPPQVQLLRAPAPIQGPGTLLHENPRRRRAKPGKGHHSQDLSRHSGVRVAHRSRLKNFFSSENSPSLAHDAPMLAPQAEHLYWLIIGVGWCGMSPKICLGTT